MFGYKFVKESEYNSLKISHQELFNEITVRNSEILALQSTIKALENEIDELHKEAAEKVELLVDSPEENLNVETPKKKSRKKTTTAKSTKTRKVVKKNNVELINE